MHRSSEQSTPSLKEAIRAIRRLATVLTLQETVHATLRLRCAAVVAGCMGLRYDRVRFGARIPPPMCGTTVLWARNLVDFDRFEHGTWQQWLACFATVAGAAS
jgi:hypothetical protein